MSARDKKHHDDDDPKSSGAQQHVPQVPTAAYLGWCKYIGTHVHMKQCLKAHNHTLNVNASSASVEKFAELCQKNPGLWQCYAQTAIAAVSGTLKSPANAACYCLLKTKERDGVKALEELAQSATAAHNALQSFLGSMGSVANTKSASAL